jgi:hypothetical protein
MAILATLFGLVGRYTGRLLTTTLGWASTLLFGRVPQNKQVLLAGATFGSLVWAVLLAGVVLPTVASILLVAVPLPDFVDPLWVRLAMLAGAIVLPLAIGFVIRLIPDAAERPTGRAAIADILRGYPLAAGLAVTLLFLAVVAVVTKARSRARRWTDAHVPIVVKPGGYDKMVRDLGDALDQSGLEVSRRAAPRVLSAPGKLLAAVAGGSARGLVPRRMWVLMRPDLEVTLHPSDILVAGTGLRVAQARAAIATRLTTTSAHLTMSAESRAIEDRIEAIAPGPSVDPAPWGTPNARELREIDQALSQTMLPYDEWEILYRMRLQVERDLLRAAGGGRVEPNTGGQALAGPNASGRSSRRRTRAGVANTSFRGARRGVGGAGCAGCDPGDRATRNGRAAPLTLPDQHTGQAHKIWGPVRSLVQGPPVHVDPVRRRSAKVASVRRRIGQVPIRQPSGGPGVRRSRARRWGLAARGTILPEGRILAGTLQHAPAVHGAGAVRQKLRAIVRSGARLPRSCLARRRIPDRGTRCGGRPGRRRDGAGHLRFETDARLWQMRVMAGGERLTRAA